MEQDVEHRQTFCYTEYVNKTNAEWNIGALAQYNNHSVQMQQKSARIDPDKLNRTDTIFITGDTACDINTINGAHILESDPLRKVYVYPNGTYKNTTYWNADNYNRNWDNFSDIEELLTDRCLTQTWCDGWTWVDAQDVATNSSESTTDNGNTSISTAHYYLLSSLSDPINANQPGVCYTVSRYDDKAFDLSSINALQNRTDILRDEYMTDYQHQIESMSDSLNGIWSAIQSLGDEQPSGNDAATYTVIVDNDPSASGYNIDIQLNEMVFSTSSGGDTSWTSSWYVIVNCPGCPDGNFSSPHLQEISDYIFGLNTSNITDFLDNQKRGPLPVNISNLVSISSPVIEYPDLPSIDFPLQLDLPIDWGFIVGIAAALDVVLLIYRWYRTIGIMARIIRGKNVHVPLKYLKVKKSNVKCCQGRDMVDKCLSIIMLSC